MMLEELVNQPFEARKMYKRNIVPQVILREDCGRTGVEFLDNGTFFYLKDGERIRHGFSCADTEAGTGSVPERQRFKAAAWRRSQTVSEEGGRL